MSEDGLSLGMLSAAITDLAQKVEVIEARSGRDSGSAGLPEHVEGRLRVIDSALADLRSAVTKLIDTKAGDDEQKALRRPWHLLTGEQAERRWADLRDWVAWLVVRNNIGPKEIPNCWYRHVGLVDELDALRWAWLDTTKPESKGTDPVWWREALHRSRTRWPLFNPNGCATTHTATRPLAVSGQREWRDFLAEELAAWSADQPAQAG